MLIYFYAILVLCSEKHQLARWVMDYEELAQLRYQEMCRIVGDVVFAMVAEGHETKRVAIADVIRTEISKGLDKWDDDQIQVMELAVRLLEE